MPNPVEKPIFIFGCCNSGTTILLHSLLKHKSLNGPKIDGQDLDGLPDSMTHYLGNSTFRMWAHHLFSQGEEEVPGSNLIYYVTEKDYNEEDKNKLIKIYSSFLKPGIRLAIKSPADTLRERLIQSYFQDAYFIGVVRNGYAVSEGIVRKREFDPDRPNHMGLKTTISDAAEQWNNANRVLNSYNELGLLKNLIILKYEDLVSNSKKVLNSVLDFCELDKEGFEIPEFQKDLNDKQIARLSTEDIGAVTNIAKPMLTKFGYDLL